MISHPPACKMVIEPMACKGDANPIRGRGQGNPSDKVFKPTWGVLGAFPGPSKHYRQSGGNHDEHQSDDQDEI